jgi:hypothetical protein
MTCLDRPGEDVEIDPGREERPDGRHDRRVARVEPPVGQRADLIEFDEAADEIRGDAGFVGELLEGDRPHPVSSDGVDRLRGARSSWPLRSGHS